MILIPGLASSGETWDTTVARYRARFACHVLTVAGFAGVPPIDGPLLPAVHRDLAEYIRAQKLDRPIIVGHSLGGTIALMSMNHVPVRSNGAFGRFFARFDGASGFNCTSPGVVGACAASDAAIARLIAHAMPARRTLAFRPLPSLCILHSAFCIAICP